MQKYGFPLSHYYYYFILFYLRIILHISPKGESLITQAQMSKTRSTPGSNTDGYETPLCCPRKSLCSGNPRALHTKWGFP